MPQSGEKERRNIVIRSNGINERTSSNVFVLTIGVSNAILQRAFSSEPRIFFSIQIPIEIEEGKKVEGRAFFFFFFFVFRGGKTGGEFEDRLGKEDGGECAAIGWSGGRVDGRNAVGVATPAPARSSQVVAMQSGRVSCRMPRQQLAATLFRGPRPNRSAADCCDAACQANRTATVRS